MALSVPVVEPAMGRGVDFNPLADFAGAASLRQVSSSGSNFAVNVSTGAVGHAANTIDPGFTAVAYSNSDPMPGAGPASTALYCIDSSSDTLAVAITAFNTPALRAIRALGIDLLRGSGFVPTAGNMGFAALNMDDGLLATGLFGIDLMSGQGMPKGRCNGTLTGLTVSAVPEPGSHAMMALGLAGPLWVHCRRARRGRDWIAALATCGPHSLGRGCAAGR